MTTRHKRHIAVLSLILVLTVTGPLYAVTPHKVDASEGCTKPDGEISMSWILCTESQRNKDEFNDIYNDTENANSDSNSDPEATNNKSAEHATQPPQPSVKPPKGARIVRDEAHRHGRGHFLAIHRPHSKGTGGSTTRRGRGHRNHHARGRKPQQHLHHSVRQTVQTRRPRAGRVRTRVLPMAEIRDLIRPGIPLSDLTASERAALKRLYRSLLKRRTTRAFLYAIQTGEDGALLRIVGYTRTKSLSCQKRIARLTVRGGHPKEQGLPDKCFVRTRYGLSTAAGLYQIVYYVNWRQLRRLLDLNDFSAENQAIAALELTRSSKVKGSKLGDGLVALIQNDLDTAIRKGTDPWASSPYSRWAGKNTKPYLAYAHAYYKRSGNES